MVPLNPYEAPPQDMKDVFKRYQKMKPDLVVNQADVVDFQLHPHRHAHQFKCSRNIPSSTLKHVFGRFMDTDGHIDYPDISVYSSIDLPGLLVLPALLPASVQTKLLSNLMHRDLSDERHKTNLDFHHIIARPQVASNEDQSNTSYFSFSPKSTAQFPPKDPSTHKALTIKQILEKKLRWVTLGGQYDWTNKVYPEEQPPSFPSDIALLTGQLFPDMRAEAAIVNLYSPGDTLSLHRDVSEEVDRGLVSISLGCDFFSKLEIQEFIFVKLTSFIMATWEVLAKTKRDSVNALIPKPWLLTSPVPPVLEQRDVTGKYIQQFLSPREIEITETDAVGIVEKTTSGQWKAKEVAEAFCHRAALAHQMVNCLHEIFFEAAIADAQKLDEYYAEHRKPIGPFHGLPISLKDQFHVKGVETTMGYVGWMNTFEGKKGTGKEKVFESEMVTELRSLGAVLFCKTSVPHTLMAGETSNNIIGYTWNPKNRNLATGGSSGGEGALIGLRGSPCGFGTDIGGSIRIPAVFNGLFGIKPSGGRLPYEGMANSMDGQNTILSVVGPIATSLRSLQMLVKGILSTQPWLHDPLVAEIPWRDEHEQAVFDLAGSSEGKQLSFGILRTDGIVQPTPPMLRAMDITVKTIERLGHKTIDWEPPSHQRCLEIGFKTWVFDGGADVQSAFALSGEPMIPSIASIYGTAQKQFTASEVAAVNVEKRAYQKEYMEYWNSTSEITGTDRPVDAIITPCAPFPAARPEQYDYYGYSTWVNVLDYSTSMLPVTTVDKSVDVADTDYKPLSETDEKVYKSYDPEMYDGAFVGVQIVARRFQEEKVLALTKILSDGLDF
ncbi:amidase [Phlyctema vagabunda]|uniref:amidase n=1 Tax=Phlyctema vagabunda TaxID=108571 RepID=A0ABR4PEA6_9HELO